MWYLTMTILLIAGLFNHIGLAYRLGEYKPETMRFSDVIMDLQGSFSSDVGQPTEYKRERATCRIENYIAAFMLILLVFASAVWLT